MNPRINALSDIAYNNHLARQPHSSFGRRTDYDKEFAELIVRECARVYWNIDDGEIHGQYVNALKQHFGVEE